MSNTMETYGIILGSAVLLLSFNLFLLFYQRRKIKSLVNQVTGLKEDIDSCNETFLTCKKTISTSEIKNIQLTTMVDKLEEQIANYKTEVAQLKSKIEVLQNTNNKLLKEVSDDVTVNIKNEDPSIVVVEKPKRKYTKRKKSNGRPATNKRPSKKD